MIVLSKIENIALITIKIFHCLWQAVTTFKVQSADLLQFKAEHMYTLSLPIRLDLGKPQGYKHNTKRNYPT